MRTLGHREGNNTHRPMCGGWRGGEVGAAGEVGKMGKDNTRRNA